MAKKLSFTPVAESSAINSFTANLYMLLEYIRCKNYDEFREAKSSRLNDEFASETISSSKYDYTSLAKNSVSEILRKGKYDEGLFTYIKGKIDKDKPVIILFDNTDNHCIMAYGYDDSDKTLFIYDPLENRYNKLRLKDEFNGISVTGNIISEKATQSVEISFVYNLKANNKGE